MCFYTKNEIEQDLHTYLSGACVLDRRLSGIGLKDECPVGIRKAMCCLSECLDFREVSEELWY